MIPVRIGCATPLSATVAPSFRFSSFGSGRGQWIGVNREMNGRSKPGRPCWILEFRIGSCTPAPASHPIFGRVFAREVGCWFWQLNFARCCVQSAECSAASSGMREDHATVGCSCDALKTRFLGCGQAQQGVDARAWTGSRLDGTLAQLDHGCEAGGCEARCCTSAAIGHGPQIIGGLCECECHSAKCPRQVPVQKIKFIGFVSFARSSSKRW